MGKCSNPLCDNSISFFSFKRKCLICNLNFCKDCFVRDAHSIEKLSKKGYCWDCYLLNNPNEIPDPVFIGNQLPTDEQTKAARSQIIPIQANPFDSFQIISDLGQGSTSKVYKVISLESRKFFALKEMSIGQTDTESIIYEFLISVLSPCANIVNCYALYRYRGNYAILLELMDRTLDAFNKAWKNKSEAAIAYIIREITRGLAYLHENHNIHRDLKSENIFVNAQGQVKLGDFGLSVQLTKERSLRDTFAGSPLWIAPEILGGRQYGLSCDVWSLGVVCYELAEGRPPFHRARNANELKLRIQREPTPVINQSWSEKYKEFILFCLQKEPNMRKTCKELLESDFLVNFNEEEARNCLISCFK
jgi:serine/threonine protein kinase